MLLALAGSALVFFGILGAIGPWRKAGSKTGKIGGLPRPSESAVKLAAQTVAGVGIKVGAHLVGPSDENRFLTYLLL